MQAAAKGSHVHAQVIAFEGESIAKMYIGNWSDQEEMMMEKVGKDLRPIT